MLNLYNLFKPSIFSLIDSITKSINYSLKNNEDMNINLIKSIIINYHSNNKELLKDNNTPLQYFLLSIHNTIQDRSFFDDYKLEMEKIFTFLIKNSNLAHKNDLNHTCIDSLLNQGFIGYINYFDYNKIIEANKDNLNSETSETIHTFLKKDLLSIFDERTLKRYDDLFQLINFSKNIHCISLLPEYYSSKNIKIILNKYLDTILDDENNHKLYENINYLYNFKSYDDFDNEDLFLLSNSLKNKFLSSKLDLTNIELIENLFSIITARSLNDQENKKILSKIENVDKNFFYINKEDIVNSNNFKFILNQFKLKNIDDYISIYESLSNDHYISYSNIKNINTEDWKVEDINKFLSVITNPNHQLQKNINSQSLCLTDQLLYFILSDKKTDHQRLININYISEDNIKNILDNYLINDKNNIYHNNDKLNNKLYILIYYVISNKLHNNQEMSVFLNKIPSEYKKMIFTEKSGFLFKNNPNLYSIYEKEILSLNLNPTNNINNVKDKKVFKL